MVEFRKTWHGLDQCKYVFRAVSNNACIIHAFLTALQGQFTLQQKIRFIFKRTVTEQ